MTKIHDTSRRCRRSADDRGAITVTVALGMTMLLGSAALAVDLGHMMVVRTESQRVADLSALAGAGAFIQSAAPNVSVAVDTWSKDFALQNSVNRTPVALLSADIQPDPANERVQVTVQNTEVRGNPIATVFGRVFGLTSVDVVTTALAEASPASGVHCSLPFFLVDRWSELGGDPNRFDLGIDYYEHYDPAAPTTTYTGYDAAAIGSRVIIEPAGATPADAQRPMPQWYFPFSPTALPGGPGSYQVSIEGCLDPGRVYDLRREIYTDPTPQPLATNLGLQALINLDPQATWDAGTNCVVDATNVGSGDPSHCRASPRLRPVVLLSPAQAPGSVPQIANVANLAGVFVEQVFGTEAAIVLSGYAGVSAASASGGSSTPPMVRTLRIVG